MWKIQLLDVVLTDIHAKVSKKSVSRTIKHVFLNKQDFFISKTLYATEAAVQLKKEDIIHYNSYVSDLRMCTFQSETACPNRFLKFR